MSTIIKSTSTIQTYSGAIFDPIFPDPTEIRIMDIAHALANQCRFSGHTRWHYSVAQHSVSVSHMVPEKDALWGLMHDAAEAYLVDLPRPLKRQPGLGTEYKLIEARLERAIAARFGLYLPIPDSVKEADSRMLVTEQRDLMPGWTGCKDGYPDVKPYDFAIPQKMPDKAERDFLERFRELYSRRT
jgi:5'-deoxynucleotidase YfbR-like HD superfamily hydrolase